MKNKINELTAELFAHKVIVWWLPVLYFLISSLFYLRTYDSAQVKISVMQMGGLAVLVLWIVRLIEAGGAAFTKDDLVTLSPFLAFLLVGIFSFIHSPYNMASVDFFLRHFFFMTVALIVIYEFDNVATDRLTNVLIWTGWVAIGYGMLQVIDTRFFPPGAGKGIDPFIWRGAFGTRVFSTYGNPNFYADFLVIIFPILLTQYFKKPTFGKLVLMAMLLVNLLLTGTKGAWVGFAIVLFMLGAVSFRYFARLIEPYRKVILAVTFLSVTGFLGYVGKDLRTRVVSVNFRLFTWEACFEMIRSQPLIGTGIGSFPPVYPAFRRPPIFHIEGKHNTETDHSENEYLEELFDNGILGFGIFLWLVVSTLFVGFKSLGNLTRNQSDKEGRPPGRAYDLTGYLIAFMGMLGHNLFDVSMRFVSSGVYLGLLSGMIVTLARGKGLYELHELREAAPAKPGLKPLVQPLPEPASAWRTIADFLIWPARLACWAALLYVSYLIVTEFAGLQGPLGNLGGGEALQWWLSWGTLSACVFGLSFVFARLALMSQNPAVPLVVLAALQPLYVFWGYFKADIHHNIAIFFSKERNWDNALAHYFTVHKLNPNFVMSLYFMGNVYNDRFNMDKVYRPEWGDSNNVPRDDYERAMDSYDKVRRLAPNYVQMHHQVGALHMKRAEWAMQHGQPAEAEKYLDMALTRFKMYQAIDPVFAPNYFRMGQIYMVRKQYQKALETYKAYIEAPMCQVAPALISNKLLRDTILSYQNYEPEPGVSYPVHHHETPEAYTNLANAYYMLENLEEAEKAYRHALAFDPNYEQAKRNLSVVYQKAQQQGRLRKLTAPKPDAGPGPFTGYEIAPRR